MTWTRTRAWTLNSDQVFQQWLAQPRCLLAQPFRFFHVKILNLPSNFKRLIQQDPSTPSILYLLSSLAHIYDLDINKPHHEHLKVHAPLRCIYHHHPDTRSPWELLVWGQAVKSVGLCKPTINSPIHLIPL